MTPDSHATLHPPVIAGVIGTPLGLAVFAALVPYPGDIAAADEARIRTAARGAPGWILFEGNPGCACLAPSLFEDCEGWAAPLGVVRGGGGGPHLCLPEPPPALAGFARRPVAPVALSVALRLAASRFPGWARWAAELDLRLDREIAPIAGWDIVGNTGPVGRA